MEEDAISYAGVPYVILIKGDEILMSTLEESFEVSGLDGKFLVFVN